MADVYDLAEKWRAELATQDAKALRHLVRTFRPVYDTLKDRLAELDRYIAAETASGRRSDPAVLFRRAQTQALLDDVASIVAEHTKGSLSLIERRQKDLVRDATKRAAALLAAAAPPGLEIQVTGLAREATLDLVGYLADGTPFSTLAGQLGASANAELRTALARSLALGENAEQRLKRMRHILGKSLHRSLVIARTETLRAHREGARRTYEQSGVVEQWRWLAARQPGRTCVVCWMMDGTVHPVTERLASHPNCRCTMVPVTRSWADLGFPGLKEPKPPETGHEAFLGLDDAEQRTILGPKAFDEWKAGRLDPRDLVGQTSSPVWGPGRRRRSITDTGRFPRDPALTSPAGRGATRSAKPSPLRARLPKAGPIRDGIQEALDAAAATLPDGLSRVIFSSRQRLPDGDYGIFDPGPPVRITIGPGSPRMSTLHEVGHLLAVEHDPVGPAMRALAQAARNTPLGRQWATWDAILGETYWLDPEELFTRAYAQLVSTTSGRPALLDELRSAIAAGEQWPATEFGPFGDIVARALAR